MSVSFSLSEMPSSESNVIQQMLAKSVVRIREESDKRKLKEVKYERLKKVKTPLSNKVLNEEGDRPVDVPTNGLEVSLVYNHLKEVSPQLAEEFAASHFFHRTEIKLLEVVSVSNQVCLALRKDAQKLKITSMKSNYDEINRKKNRIGINHRAYLPQDDDILRASMVEAGDDEIDCATLARILGRSQGSVRSRVNILKRNGGVSSKKAFTLVEDQIIMESLAIPRLKIEKLVDIVLLRHQCADIIKQLDKSEFVVQQRWQNILQPWLLQHYSGTLNLRVERMLSRFIMEHFTDISDIDWPMVASRSEFAGHTQRSLKMLFSRFRDHSKYHRRKLGVLSGEPSLADVATHCEQVYGQGGGKMGSTKLKRQMDVIDFFERKVAELDIKDFL